jgi:hypothetical protein
MKQTQQNDTHQTNVVFSITFILRPTKSQRTEHFDRWTDHCSASGIIGGYAQ